MFPAEFSFGVECPEGERCALLHCPFEHAPASRKRRGGDDQPAGKSTKQSKLNREMTSKLVPRPVHPNAPESVQQRLKFLKQLENYYKTKDPHTCIERAVSKEYEVASSCNSKISYTAKIKTLLYNLMKYGNENGKVVQAKMTPGNKDDWLAQLYEICVPRNKLKRHGFCLEIPKEEPTEAKESFLPPKPARDPNFKTCLRCHTDFTRDAQMEETQCRYHPGKPEVIKQAENSAASNDYNTRVYSCCNQPMGEANGCATLKHHVFKLMDYGEMHEEIPFVELPAHTEDSKALKAVGMDCEMGFTSCGFECIKISIVDYVSEAIVLDKLVKPKGQVIDLNTHVSDVAAIPEDALTLPQIQALLQEIFDSHTIIIGHGLENDFNCLRLIPPHVVDTAILYSESSLVRKKDSLKKLAWKYLSMNIQSGTHDSVEDCVIPIKIVKNKVAKLTNQ